METIKQTNETVYEFILKYKELLLNNLKKNIVGIYLSGSLTYGGFNEKSSDIDIVVITKKMIVGNELEKIKNIHDTLKEIDKKWSNRFEASYTPLEMLKEKESPKMPRPYYNETFYNEATYGNEWLINNYLLCNYGKIIYGPKFSKLIKESITIKDIQQSCTNDFFIEWKPKINDKEYFRNSHNQAYIVVNICRIIYTIINGETANKPKSTKWVKERYEKWEKLITEAEEWDYSKIMNKENETKEFIKYFEEIIKADINKNNPNRT
jgi:predicted nucleotidyltransferase